MVRVTLPGWAASTASGLLRRGARKGLCWVLGAGLLLFGPVGCPQQEPASETAGPSESAQALRKLSVGDPAPDLTLRLQDGEQVALKSLRGQQVVLYFYPKDDTPGCTIEAQQIRDSFAAFRAAKVRVLGVSLQDASSHQRFIDKHDLPFDLVVDTDAEVARAFGVPLNGGVAARQTVLIGADGKLKQIWRQVTPDGHAQELLQAIERP